MGSGRPAAPRLGFNTYLKTPPNATSSPNMMVAGSKFMASVSAELTASHRFIRRPGDLVADSATVDKVEIEDKDGVLGGILNVMDVTRLVCWTRPVCSV